MLSSMMLAVTLFGAAAQPLYEAELIFPAEKFHNHSSTIVETPKGDLLARMVKKLSRPVSYWIRAYCVERHQPISGG